MSIESNFNIPVICITYVPFSYVIASVYPTTLPRGEQKYWHPFRLQPIFIKPYLTFSTTIVVNSPTESELSRVNEREILAISERSSRITHFGLILWRNWRLLEAIKIVLDIDY